VGVQHVALETRPDKVGAEVEFWELVGFTAVPEPPTLTGRATWLQSGGTQIHLLYTPDPVIPPRGHVAIVCAKYAQTRTALATAGFETVESTRHWGSPRCFTQSPGGHRVELMAFPPE
jgi:hypothetical protein